MKNDEKRRVIGLASFHTALLGIYLIIMVTFLTEGTLIDRETAEFAAVLTAILLSTEFISVITVLAVRLLFPHLQRRHAALTALGERGIIKAARDPMARLAYRGVYALLEEDFPKAEELLNLAMARSDINQNKVFCIEWLIKLYERTGADDKLLWCFRKSVEFAPENSVNQIRLGHAYMVDGRLEQAMYCFQQAIRYNPNEGYAYYSISRIYMLRGEDEKALNTLNELLKINESHPMVYAELAMYHAMHDEIEECDECFRKAVLCGIKEPENLEKQLDAVKRFRRGDTYDGENLPGDYYRKTEKDDEKPSEKE